MLRSGFSWVCPQRRERALFSSGRRAIVWRVVRVEVGGPDGRWEAPPQRLRSTISVRWSE